MIGPVISTVLGKSTAVRARMCLRWTALLIVWEYGARSLIDGAR